MVRGFCSVVGHEVDETFSPVCVVEPLRGLVARDVHLDEEHPPSPGLVLESDHLGAVRDHAVVSDVRETDPEVSSWGICVLIRVDREVGVGAVVDDEMLDLLSRCSGGHTSHLSMCRCALGKRASSDQSPDRPPDIHQEFF